MSLFRGAEMRALSADDFPWVSDGAASVMSTERALSVIPVYAAVRLISETVASLPLHAYRKTPTGREQITLPRFLAEPPDGSTTLDWVQRCMTSLLVRGNAFGQVVVWRGGYPDGVVWLDPSRAHARVPQGEVLPRYWVDGHSIDRAQVVHVPAVVVPGSAEGVNPVRAFATTYDGAREVQEARRLFAKRRQVPGSTLRNTKRTLDPKVADAVAARAEEKIRNGAVFAHGADWEFKVLELPQQDVAFLASIKADANQVASIYTVPPEMIGGTSGGSLTYSTVEGQLNWILTMTTRVWITKLEAAFSRLLPDAEYVRFAPDAVVRTDTKTRFEVHKMARDMGLRSIDEIRELEDLSPLPDGQGQSFTPAVGGGRELSAAEVSQKVYLAVQAGVLSAAEGRELIRAAGADIDPAIIPPRPVVVGVQKPGGVQ